AREPRRRPLADCMQLARELPDARLCIGDRPRGHFQGIDAGIERGELRSRLLGPREELVVALAAEPPLGIGDPLELRLDLLEPAGLGAKRRQERPQLRRGLAQAQLDVAQLVAGPRELGREALEWSNLPFGMGCETGGALALLRRQRLRGGR